MKFSPGQLGSKKIRLAKLVLSSKFKLSKTNVVKLIIEIYYYTQISYKQL